MQLTTNFNLGELEVTNTGLPNGVPLDLLPNAQRLAACLQAVRDRCGAPLSVASGYRSPAVNARVGGSSTSAHCFALAADCSVRGLTSRQLAAVVSDLVRELRIDQLILEFPDEPKTWVHIGLAKDGVQPRYQLMTAIRLGGKTQYVKGLQ